MSPNPRLTASRLREASPLRPKLALVLGTGFEPLRERVAVSASIPYPRLPGFPPVTVRGHAGQLLLGRLGGEAVAVLSGRAHYYEGHSLAAITFPIRVLAEFGIRALLLTNAAGAINPRLRPGDLMIVTDHINLMGANPLRGETADPEELFVDMTNAYDPGLIELLKKAGRERNLRLKTGVYLAVAGPSFETPAEIRAFARLGADAVGMSTVPETIVARQCGLSVAAVSCITNPGAGLEQARLSHARTLAAAMATAGAADLLEQFARWYGR
ncbi:MAG: purine-nucleoside phosphorylase [Limisphaerales bacterium]